MRAQQPFPKFWNRSGDITMESTAPKFPFFPIPAEGETIYSGFCRCAERSGLPDQYILSALTGQNRKTTLLSVLPGHLRVIASALPPGHPWADPAHAIQHHTSLPYFTYFDSPGRRDSAARLLATSTCGNDVGLSLGLTQYRCGAVPKHPRFCSICAAEDEINVGFSYFHREHQLPGVAVCWKHGEILSHGCQQCGPYPIPGRGLSMLGRCKCDGELVPLPAYGNLPKDHAALTWLAVESARLVSSTGTTLSNPRAVLRQLAIDGEFGRGSLPTYTKIGAALSDKYGADTLDWLGVPAWSNGRPSAWVRRLPQVQLTGMKRSPTILFLLFIGLFYESIPELEAAVGKGRYGSPCPQTEASLRSSASAAASSPDKRATIVTPAWARDLQEFLAKHSFRLSAAAADAGISPYAMAVEARKQGLRVPLSRQTAKKLGQEKLSRIRVDLQIGVPKKEVQRRYGVSEWVMFLVELDSPKIAQDSKALKEVATRDAHRRKILDLIARDPGASRSTVFNQLPGTYDYIISNDRDWFYQQFPQRKQPVKEPQRPTRIDRAALDKEFAKTIQDLVPGLLASENRPERISKHRILKHAGFGAKYSADPSAFPKATLLFDKLCESQTDFIKRKIRWAIAELQESGQTISINTLRRKAAVHPSKLRDYREFVINAANKEGAAINMRSFFAGVGQK